jgi:hypothetical protein
MRAVLGGAHGGIEVWGLDESFYDDVDDEALRDRYSP